jgi:hypothetical protein
MWSYTQYCTAIDSDTPAQCTQWQDLSGRVDPTQDDCSQLEITAPANTSVSGYWLGSSVYSSISPVLFQSFDTDANRSGGGWLLDYIGSDSSYQVMVPDLGTNTLEDYHSYLLLKQGQATFGSYRGNDRIIYWRESQ